jgi:long-subunit acyl-CoA synthetase (AMP-forming)
MHSHPSAAQVWVYGNSFETCVVAIVVPDQEVLMAWAEKEGIKGTFSEVYCPPPLPSPPLPAKS